MNELLPTVHFDELSPPILLDELLPTVRPDELLPSIHMYELYSTIYNDELFPPVRRGELCSTAHTDELFPLVRKDELYPPPRIVDLSHKQDVQPEESSRLMQDSRRRPEAQFDELHLCQPLNPGTGLAQAG